VNDDHLLNFIAISHKMQGFLISRVAVEGTNHGITRGAVCPETVHVQKHHFVCD